MDHLVQSIPTKTLHQRLGTDEQPWPVTTHRLGRHLKLRRGQLACNQGNLCE